ncbi:MAG: hypothetical protein PHQ43_08140 [Dehalococcoidales bacterium]|nr:hypothetical protein [Dehalococcoidales bacterium]
MKSEYEEIDVLEYYCLEEMVPYQWEYDAGAYPRLKRGELKAIHVWLN